MPKSFEMSPYEFCFDISDTCLCDSNRVIDGSPRLKQEKLENIMEVKVEKCPLKWQSPKSRSMCFRRFSETPHAVLTDTSCNDSVAYQINKFRSFSSLMYSFPWQIQNTKKTTTQEWVIQKPSPNRLHPISDGGADVLIANLCDGEGLHLWNQISYCDVFPQQFPTRSSWVLIQSASLFVKEGVPVPLEISKKKRMSGGDLIS